MNIRIQVTKTELRVSVCPCGFQITKSLTRINERHCRFLSNCRKRWHNQKGNLSMFKQILLSSALAVGLVVGVSSISSAAPITAPSGVELLSQAQSVLPVEQIRHRKYRRHRHGRRHRSRRRGHRHYYGGYWYAYPWWLHTVPRRYGRCEYWQRQCRRNWGRGRDYRGCMRHHGCRP